MLNFYALLFQNVLVSQNFRAQSMRAQSAGRSMGCKIYRGAKCGVRNMWYKAWDAKYRVQSVGAQSLRCKVWGCKVGKPVIYLEVLLKKKK